MDAESVSGERRDLPSGTVALLFTDIEGSTRLLSELGEAYAEALAEHRRVLRGAFERHGGAVVDTQGDAFFIAFSSTRSAIAAADEAQERLALPVRMGIHVGRPQRIHEGYVGLDVHLAARICGAAHGGQIVVSAQAREDAGEEREFRDLGLHRLKDLAQPVRLFQLGDRDFPALRSLSATNLPIPANPLVGRQRELEELTRLLRDTARVVTVTGPGGAGKTRLALEVAAELVGDFVDGVFWAPLASVRDAELALPTIAETLGARTALADHVDEKRMLLLLDNFEQLLPAAMELSSLLERCPNLRLLVTSRAPLRLSGERELYLPPLHDDDAVTLFMQRARAIRPELEAGESVHEICRRLDGLPLAIELAAARIRALEPDALLAQLEHRLPVLTAGPRDLPTRQRTLHATIAWSHDLLTPEEQRALARLAVFAGSWSAEAAESVCNAPLETLESLVEQSLVRFRGRRFRMLETIREFALERLREAGEEDAYRERHARYFVQRAEQAGPAVPSPEAPEVISALEVENENMLAALTWLVAARMPEPALRLGGSLRLFWGARGYAAAARPLLERALELEEPVPASVRGKALTSLASVWAGSDPRRAEAVFDEAQRLYEEAGDPYGAALSLLHRAHARMHWDVDGAAELASRGLAVAEGLGEKGLLGLAHNELGLIAQMRGDHALAARLLREAIADWRECGNRIGAAGALGNLSAVVLETGDLERAEELAESALAENRALGHELHIAGVLELLGGISIRRGQREWAAERLAESLRIHRDHAEALNALDCLELLALTFAADEPAIAAQCWGAVGAARQRLSVRGTHALLDLVEASKEACRRELGKTQFEDAWLHGQSLSVDEAIELGLSASERSRGDD